jgi:hypothetical protein
LSRLDTYPVDEAAVGGFVAGFGLKHYQLAHVPEIQLTGDVFFEL